MYFFSYLYIMIITSLTYIHCQVLNLMLLTFGWATADQLHHVSSVKEQIMDYYFI
jgi:hypothetical protein